MPHLTQCALSVWDALAHFIAGTKIFCLNESALGMQWLIPEGCWTKQCVHFLLHIFLQLGLSSSWPYFSKQIYLCFKDVLQCFLSFFSICNCHSQHK